MPTQPLRFEEATPPAIPPGSARWWYCRARDTRIEIAIENPRIVPDRNDDGVPFYSTAHDGFLIFDAGAWRDATVDERDEYGDDVHRWLRAADWD